mgnify:CR=1 FL=1
MLYLTHTLNCLVYSTACNFFFVVQNFSVIYIKMGFPRLDPSKQAELVPALLNCLEGRSQSQQDRFAKLESLCLAYHETSVLSLETNTLFFSVDSGSHVQSISNSNISL